MNPKTTTSLNFIDRLVGYVSPSSLVARTKARLTMSTLTDNGYVIPGARSRAMKGVTATPNSPNQDTLTKTKGSRAISRDLYMRSPLAAGALKTAKTNVVGPGLRFQSRIDRKFLGLDDDTANEWERNLEREFNVWASSKHSDYSGTATFWENQGLAFLSSLMNGDMFFMLPWKKPYRSGNWKWELRLKMIEADLVRNPKGLGFYNSLSKDTKGSHPGGVELNKAGEVVAYHVAADYESEGFNTKEEFLRVPIRATNGRQNIYHLMSSDRIDGRRGIPFLAPVVESLQMLTALSKAELTSAVVASMFTVFIKDMSGLGGTLKEPFTPQDTLLGGGSEGPNAEQLPKDPGEEMEIEMGSAAVTYLDDDKEIQIADPKKTDTAFPSFYRACAEEIGAGLEQPVEQILKVFNSSYSGARAALQEAWKAYRTKRIWFGDSFCQPTLDAFLEEAVSKGRIQAPGFFDDSTTRAAWGNGVWIGFGNGQIDPLKETRASLLKIENNLSTREDEFQMDQYGSWDSMAERKKREDDKLKDLGLSTGYSEAPQTPIIGDDTEEEEGATNEQP